MGSKFEPQLLKNWNLSTESTVNPRFGADIVDASFKMNPMSPDPNMSRSARNFDEKIAMLTSLKYEQNITKQSLC